MNSWMLHITSKTAGSGGYFSVAMMSSVPFRTEAWCTHTWGHIHNKCHEVVLSGRFKAILQARALAHGKNQTDYMASATPCVTSIHHYHRHPLIILPQTLRWFREKIIKSDSNWPFWTDAGIAVWCGRCPGFGTVGCHSCQWHLALMLQEEEAVGVRHLSLCEGMHWPNCHPLLFHHLLFWLK